MEIKEYLYGEFLVWDDIAHLGLEQRKAIILTNGEVDKDKGKVVLTLSLIHDKKVIKYYCKKRDLKNLVSVWGTDTDKWREKSVFLVQRKYSAGDTIELKPMLTSNTKIQIDDIFKELEKHK